MKHWLSTFSAILCAGLVILGWVEFQKYQQAKLKLWISEANEHTREMNESVPDFDHDRDELLEIKRRGLSAKLSLARWHLEAAPRKADTEVFADNIRQAEWVLENWEETASLEREKIEAEEALERARIEAEEASLKSVNQTVGIVQPTS